MKNLRIFAILLTSAVFLIACEKQHPVKDGVDIGVDAAKMVWAEGPNMPTSDGGIIPEVIPGENKGGNRTCEEVYRYFMGNVEWNLCAARKLTMMKAAAGPQASRLALMFNWTVFTFHFPYPGA